MMNEVCWFWYVLGLRVDIYIFVYTYECMWRFGGAGEIFIYIRWGGFGVCVVS